MTRLPTTHLVIVPRDAVKARMHGQVDGVEVVQDLFALVARLLGRVVLARPQPEVTPLHRREDKGFARFGLVERRDERVEERDRRSRVWQGVRKST